MLGEFDFSDEKLQDTIGVLPPKKQTEIIPKKLGGAKLMILMPFQKDIENPTTDYVPLSRWGRDDVAHVLEVLMGLAAESGHLRTRTGPRDEELRKARVCYNHLAGHMGILMYDGFRHQGFLDVGAAGLTLTNAGASFVDGFGVNLEALQAQKSPLCRECLDWSERRSHLAGSLGRSLLAQMEYLGWAKRIPGSRIVRFTKAGQAEFDATFEL